MLALVAWAVAGEAAQPERGSSSATAAYVTDQAASATASDQPEASAEPAAANPEIAQPQGDDGVETTEPVGWCCGDECTSCGGSRWWLDASYMHWWTNGNAVPALVTTNATVPPRPQAGVLGTGDTAVLLGDDELDEGRRSGVALTLGGWLDEHQTLAIQATWLYAGDPSDQLDASWESPGVPVLARPFFNAATHQEDAQLVAYPDVVAGVTTADSNSYLQSFEALVRSNWRRGSRGRIDVLGGYRYLGFREGLRLEEHLVLLDPGGVAQIGTTIDLFDQFHTRNDFHGGEMGLLTSFHRGPVVLDMATKLGLGNVFRELVSDGSTYVQTPAGGRATTPGGLLTLPSNMGTYRDDAFAVLPELDVKARWQLTDSLSVSVGYHLLFLTEVYRTGRQIDRSIDASQLPGALPVNDTTAADQHHPLPILSSSTLRAQGLTVGVGLTY